MDFSTQGFWSSMVTCILILQYDEDRESASKLSYLTDMIWNSSPLLYPVVEVAMEGSAAVSDDRCECCVLALDM